MSSAVRTVQSRRVSGAAADRQGKLRARRRNPARSWLDFFQIERGQRQTRHEDGKTENGGLAELPVEKREKSGAEKQQREQVA